MDDNRHAGESPFQPLRVAHIAEKIPETGMIKPRRPHLMLLQFIAAEDNQFLRPVLAQHDFHKLLAKGTRPPGHEHNLV